MKISIVSASFNQGRFISKCLKSVINQRGRFVVEHIIFDNCSNDNTQDLLRAYAASQDDVDVKLNIEPDKGQTDAINKGFSLATGDVVCWLNTDEWYEDGALARVVNYFENNPDVDVVFGDCRFVGVDGALVKEKKEYFYSRSMLIFYGCFIPSCSTFVRRRVIDNGIYLNPEFKVTMDFDWYVRIAKAGFKFSHLPHVIAYFTWHDANISTSFIERRKSERLLVQERYSGVPGPKIFRHMVYGAMRYIWVLVRVVRRAYG